jgi:undecaprenyl-phosphate 4-deoxy-4-formamido-L-arabinose transferase
LPLLATGGVTEGWMKDGTSLPDRGPESARVGIVIGVYQGASTLPRLLQEILPLTKEHTSPQGHLFRVSEVILVHDCGLDQSDLVMQTLAGQYPFVKTVWLSRNFGQHSAIIAGMAQSSAEWLVTMDEDGQHDPSDIVTMLDRAIETGALLVYAKPLNAPPHGRIRNFCSDLTKWVARSFLSSHRLRWFHSYRLLRGDIGRALSKYCATHVYIDVALSWLVGDAEVCPLRMRPEWRKSSNWTFVKLFGHFWKLVLASGTKPLRFVGLLGIASFVLSLGLTAYALWSKWVWQVQVPGWTSLMIAMAAFSGMLLFSQAVLAEYLGIAITMAMGKPLYVTLPHPARRRVPAPGCPSGEVQSDPNLAASHEGRRG